MMSGSFNLLAQLFDKGEQLGSRDCATQQIDNK